MNAQGYHFVGRGRRTVAIGGAIVAGLLLLLGGTWRGVAAEFRASATHPATNVTMPIGNSIAGGRDSYADVVQVVAPAVVTIRTEGRASVSPTQFQTPNDDFFRRFFGDPGEQGDRNDGPSQMPRSFKAARARVGRRRRCRRLHPHQPPRRRWGRGYPASR